MSAQEKGASLITDAMMQGFNRYEAIQIVSFTVSTIINHVNITNSEHTFWIEVMDYLESN
jgi:siderophore synthetase component